MSPRPVSMALVPALLAWTSLACISVRRYPRDWPSLDRSSHDLSGVYRDEGICGPDAWWLPWDERLTTTLSSLLVQDADGRKALEAQPRAPRTVEIVDADGHLAIVVREGDRELARCVQAREWEQTDGDTASNVGGFVSSVSWTTEDGDLVSRDSGLFLTLLLNGYGRDTLVFRRAVDGSLVVESRFFGFCALLVYPFFHGYSRYWTRWQLDEAAAAMRAAS